GYQPGALAILGSNPSDPTTNFSLIKRFLGLFLRKKFSKPSFDFEIRAERAIKRALQLYLDLKEVKVFNNYKYYYHESMAEADLKAGISLKESYIRKVKGVDARVGYNWEACVEWFIDKFTKGAEFQTQDHRSGDMDPRRITLHLIKNVGDRRRGAEVDRVWTVTPRVFAKPITYVLECKWGVIHKRDVDEFFEILRWSKRIWSRHREGEDGEARDYRCLCRRSLRPSGENLPEG
ncbi:MAG: hypothetical protein ACUVRA_06740, partial [Candidatus Bathyarchaeaceae archaeon]